MLLSPLVVELSQVTASLPRRRIAGRRNPLELLHTSKNWRNKKENGTTVTSSILVTNQ